MTQKPKRPPSVWISQIILVIYMLIFLGALAMTLLGAASINTAAGGAVIILIALLVFGFFIATLAAAFWGLMKRRSWGRWLTVGILSLFVLISVVQTFSNVATGGGSSAYRSGQLLGAMIFIVPFAYLVFRLATGDAAYDFFNPPEEEPEESWQPPPPPTFSA